MFPRPPVGVDVVLERPGAPELDAEVGGYDGEQVLLTVHGDADTPPSADAEATLMWTTERGVCRAPVVIAGDGTDDGTGWRVTLTAAATRTQRREYVRLPLHDHMTLSHAGGVERAMLADLSEAALRVRLPESRAQVLQPGAEVQAAFTLNRTGFVLRGSVLRAQPGEEEDAVDLIVMLNIPPRTANVLRRSVVLEQIKRRSAPRGGPTTDPAL